MSRIEARMAAAIASFFCALCATPPAWSQVGVGTWTRTIGPNTPGNLTMTVEACCHGGRRLTYHLLDIHQTLVVESAFDGQEVPVLVDGKPSGETMTITKVDPSHTVTILKMNGKPFGTSKCAISADGNTLTVENDFSASVGGNAVGKFTETWVRK